MVQGSVPHLKGQTGGLNPRAPSVMAFIHAPKDDTFQEKIRK